MKKNLLVIGLLILFVCLLSLTIYVSFSSNTTTQEVLIKSIEPVYDETSTIEVDNNNVVFNDKNQVVKYNVVLENTQDYDVKISDISLSTPTEKFLQYKVEGISTEDEIKANSTKELIISFETMGIEGWGRNFADELTANISFEKIVKQEVVPPVEEDKNEEKQPSAPATNIEEVINKSEKIEVSKITNNTIEFKETNKLKNGDKIAVWLYSEPVFLGYFDVVENDGTKQIVGLEEALKNVEPSFGGHNIVLVSEEKETIGYISVYVNEKKELSKDESQNTMDNEKPPVTNPSTDNKNESSKGDGKVENPYTSDKKSVGLLIITTCITGIAVIVASKNKLTRYTVFILMLSPAFTITNAEEVMELSIKNNVSFESQNIMKPSYILADDGTKVKQDYWAFREKIKNFYIQNEVIEIKEYIHKFDVTESGNGRVMAYLVANKDDSSYYDAHLVADGIIYPNTDASYYFNEMINLEILENLSGFDTSRVKNMYDFFRKIAYNNTETFSIDLNSFNTSNCENMSNMFVEACYNCREFNLDVSNLDTSKVTNMKSMFNKTGVNDKNFSLDVSNFNTSKVTNMSWMFANHGENKDNVILDLSNFDTSNVIDMNHMFSFLGNKSTSVHLKIDSFDTRKVTNMSYMFRNTAGYSSSLKVDVSKFNTSNVTNMNSMFIRTGYRDTNFTLDVSNFDTSKVTDMSRMLLETGYNSALLNTSITIRNPNITSYESMLESVAVQDGTKLKVHYTPETEELVDKMIATKSSDSKVVKGNLIVDVDKLTTGDEIHISGEKFNVISQTDDTITMLAQYTLGTDYKQSVVSNGIEFNDRSGWEYTPGPKEIDIQDWSTSPKMYVNAYVEILKESLGDDSISGDLITLKELKDLGCTISDDYSYIIGLTCNASSYKAWLVNEQSWWTRSVGNDIHVWCVQEDGSLTTILLVANYSGIRPIITISKETLRNLG